MNNLILSYFIGISFAGWKRIFFYFSGAVEKVYSATFYIFRVVKFSY